MMELVLTLLWPVLRSPPVRVLDKWFGAEPSIDFQMLLLIWREWQLVDAFPQYGITKKIEGIILCVADINVGQLSVSYCVL